MLFAAVSWLVAGLASSLALYLPNASSETPIVFLPLLILSLAIIGFPIIIATIVVHLYRPALLLTGAWRLIGWSTAIAATCGVVVGLADGAEADVRIRFALVAAGVGALGGTAGCLAVRAVRRAGAALLASHPGALSDQHCPEPAGTTQPDS